MAATGTIALYAAGIVAAWSGEVDLEGDTLKVVALPNAATPDFDAHESYSDISEDELSDSTNWPEGGVTLTNVAITVVGASDIVRFSADDISQSGVTLSNVQRLACYDDTHDNDVLLWHAALNTALNPVGDFDIDFTDANNAMWTASY